MIPRHEVDYIFDLSAEEYTAFWNFAHKVATAMKAVMPCKRIGVAVMGLEVPHAHIHLIPINKESDMNFFAGKLTLEDSEMAEIAKKINDEFCKENLPDAAILCIPKNAAMVMADQLVGLGIKGFWNFSHYDLALKYPGVKVENVHFGDSLMTLSYRLHND